MSVLLKNCSIVSDGYDPKVLEGIYIEGNVIKEIGQRLEKKHARVINMEGKIVLPGFIDMHCSICDPGQEYIEDIETVSRSAARGGFTTITCLPNTIPTIDNKTVVEYIVSKSKAKALINIYPYGSISVGCEGREMASIGEMRHAGIVGISDGDEFIDEAYFLRNVMNYAKMFDLPIITHCEDRGLSGKGVMNQGYTASSLGLAGMPREAEDVIVARNLILAENTGARLHLAHISTKGAVQLVREAKGRGVSVTCETSPHYFLLTEQAAMEYNTLAKTNPPLRTQEDVDAILQGILDGTIDVIASGHMPTTESDKNKEFDRAAYGISSLETVFSLCHTRLVVTGLLSLQQLVQLLSEKPAEILGLNHKGRIAVNMDAEFAVVDTQVQEKIEPAHFASKAKFSPFAQEEVQGRVLYSMIGGKVIS